MPDKKIEKVAEEATEKVEKATEKVKEAAEEVSKEIEEATEEVKKVVKETEQLEVAEKAAVVGKTVEEIDDLNLLEEETLLVEIERGDKTITPKGDTEIKAGDIVTFKSPEGVSKKVRNAFTRES